MGISIFVGWRVFAPAMDYEPLDTKDEAKWLIAELDFGSTPAGVLIVREARWQRVVGAVLGFLVGIPAAWATTVIAVHFGDIGSALLFSVFAVLALGGGVWLVSELLNANCYYLALDSQRFYRRWGPRRLIILALDQLTDFSVQTGTLYVCHQPSKKRITVMKNAYAPQDIATLARRMNTWCKAPPDERESRITRLKFVDAQETRTRGNRQIAWGLSMLCLYPPLIVLSAQLKLLNAGVLSIILWSIYTVAALMSLIAGVVRRFNAASHAQSVRDSSCPAP